MSTKILSSLSLIITVFISASVVQEGHAQHSGNAFGAASQIKNVDQSSDGVGVIIAAIASVIAAIGLFFNFFQMKKNQANFTAQLEESKRQFNTQIEENQKKFLEQMRANEKVNNAQLWLSFREFLSKYDDIHLYLRPKGKWSLEDKGPSTADEWAKVEAYMGVFEHANRMLDMQLIDLETFKDIYKYRLNNILSNRIIREEKLRDAAGYWQNFIDLCHKVGLATPDLAGK